MTPDQAEAKWEKCLEVIEKLAEEFPCPECEGSGEGEARTAKEMVFGSPPCPRCWGRGFVIPDEEGA
jgi:DnaJ-class molecular chaperone